LKAHLDRIEPGLGLETIATLSGILASPREERSLPWQQPLKLSSSSSSRITAEPIGEARKVVRFCVKKPDACLRPIRGIWLPRALAERRFRAKR
jgi:hypothetical protein